MKTEEKQRCQSCGMPLGPGWYGTENTGKESHTYCTYCYKDGEFTQPDLTLDGMIAKSVGHMTARLQMPLPQAETLARDVIPKLKRWT